MIGVSQISVAAYRGGGGSAPVNLDFVSTWDTTQAGSASDTIVLPMTAGIATVDWGDGTINTSNTHTYAVGGIKTISITGTIEGFRFANGGDKLKITDVSNWGTFNITTDQAFYGCSNLDFSATDAPTITTTSFAYCLFQCDSLTTPDLSNWDTSSVTNMLGAVAGCDLFNGKLDGWVHSGVTNIQSILAGSKVFNQDLNTWDVSGVTVATDAFVNCDAFDGSVAGWSWGSVSLSGLFNSCNVFTGIGVDTWNFSSVTNANALFAYCPLFNGDISGWNTSSCTNMYLMLAVDTSFDRDLSGWDINQVTNLGLFLAGVTLSTANYDALLIAWDAQGAMSFSGTASFGNSKYTSGGAAEAARTSLISKWGAITDGGPV